MNKKLSKILIFTIIFLFSVSYLDLNKNPIDELNKIIDGRFLTNEKNKK